MQFTRLFSEFFESEKSGGIVLIFVTLISLLLSNFLIGQDYVDFWHYEISGHSVTHWINDGLMTIFFLLIGLELEREIYIGELSDFKSASLPVIAALGGMLVPAGIYFLFTSGTSFTSGAGIPMATDIAFAVGILSLLGSKVPLSLKVFLTALAVIDDLGAILVIAIFYGGQVSLINLAISLSIMAGLFILNRRKVHVMWPYLIGGFGMWYFMLHSGIHATIAGVLLAFVIPFGKGTELTISYRLQQFLHKPVAFFILPLFALANTAILVKSGFGEMISQTYSLGIFAGLYLGKPLGILLFCFLAIKLKLTSLPKGLKWSQLFGTGMLAGIGFTMSIFITLLAFDDTVIIDNAKLIIMIASLMAAITGYIILNKVLTRV